MIKPSIYGEGLKAQLRAAAKDRLYHFTLADETIRGALVHGTRLVHEMRANHELGILETLVLGHAYMGALLMASTLKGNDRLALQIECAGPVKGLVVEANAFGEVRGYLKNVPIPVSAPLEDFDLSPFFGPGFLTVTRHLQDAKQPFSGKVMLQYGNIGQDLAHYYLASEQIPTALHLSIYFDGDGLVQGAGGLLVQALPGADAGHVADIENRMALLLSLGTSFSSGVDAPSIMNDLFSDYRPRVIADRRVEFMCHCNESRVRQLLALLPETDLADLLDHGPFPVEMRCQYCNTAYFFDQAVIADIYETASNS